MTRAARVDKISKYKSLKPKSREPQQKPFQKTFVSNSNPSTSKFVCYKCKGDHSVHACKDFLKLSDKRRLEKVSSYVKIA